MRKGRATDLDRVLREGPAGVGPETASNVASDETVSTPRRGSPRLGGRRSVGAHGTRRPRWLPLVLFLSTTGTICRSTTSSTPQSGADSIVSSNGTGTFAGTDSQGGSVRGTISVTPVYCETAAGDAGPSSLLVVAELGGESGSEDLEFSSPSGLVSGVLNVNIGFGGPPVPGAYTEQSIGASGGIGLGYSTASGSEAFSATAGTGSTPEAGSWTLTIASLTVPDEDGGFSDSPLYETAHGMLSATLTDGHGGSGTLQLTF